MYILSRKGFTVTLIEITLVLGLVGPSMADDAFACYDCDPKSSNCRDIVTVTCGPKHTTCRNGKEKGMRLMGCSTETPGCTKSDIQDDHKDFVCFCQRRLCNEAITRYEDFDPETGLFKGPGSPPASTGTAIPPVGTVSSCVLLGSLLMSYLAFNG